MSARPFNSRSWRESARQFDSRNRICLPGSGLDEDSGFRKKAYIYYFV